MSRLALRTVLLGLALLLTRCAVQGYGPPPYDVGADYYAPVVGNYGGWGGGYRVGPFRDFDRPYGGGFGVHPWHGADRGAFPSIPGGFRGRAPGGFHRGPAGGFHGGGFHGGGGGHGR